MDKASVGTKSVVIENVSPQELWIHQIPGGKCRVKWEIAIAQNERSLYPDKNQRLNIIFMVNGATQCRCFRNNWEHKHKKLEEESKILFKNIQPGTQAVDFTVAVIYTHTYIGTYTYVHIYINI